MRTDQESGIRRICLALLITIAILAIAGCIDSTPNRQDRITATDEMPNENPATGTAITTGATSAQVLSGTERPEKAPDPSVPSLTIDPVSDLKIGDLLVVSGTTSLPERTPVYLSWKYESSGEDKVLANRQVLSGGDGVNRFRFVFDTSGFKPGSYTMTVANGKKDVSASAQFSLAGTYRGTDTPLYYPGTALVPESAGSPGITVEPIDNRQQGDIFLISGTTNLPAGTLLFYRVYPAYFEDKTIKPVPSSGSSLMDNVGGDTIVIGASGNANRWSFAMDAGNFKKMEYIVNISTVNEDYTTREIFGRTQFTLY